MYIGEEAALVGRYRRFSPLKPAERVMLAMPIVAEIGSFAVGHAS